IFRNTATACARSQFLFSLQPSCTEIRFSAIAKQDTAGGRTYRRLVSAAKGATESATEVLGRRGTDSGMGGRCSRVPNKGASSTPAPKDTNWSAAHMDSTRRRWREVSTFTGRVWKLRKTQSKYRRCAKEGCR